MKVWSLGLVSNHCYIVCSLFYYLFACSHFYYRFTNPGFTTHILSSLRRTSAPIQLTIVLGVFRTQENHPITTPSTIFFHLLLLIYFVKCFPGVAELKTQLLRLIGILWLPLCRINKLGYTSLEGCCNPLHLWVISVSQDPDIRKLIDGMKSHTH